MNKFIFLALVTSMATLGGCGGGSSSDGSSTSNNPDNSVKPNQPTETTSKCDRGVLLNSTLPAASSSIFDESLYQFNYLFDYDVSNKLAFYADELKRDGQMLYLQSHIVHNSSDQQLNRNEASNSTDYILNNHGLFISSDYQKQNNGWPAGYLVATQGTTLTRATFNNLCEFKADKVDFDFEKVDLSGKKIADIFPEQILENQSISRTKYTYLAFDWVNQFKLHDEAAFTKLLQSGATFPQGAYVYVPKTVVYEETQFYFGADSYGITATLDAWIANYTNPLYYHGMYKFKKGSVSGFNVAYSVDDNGNELYYPGADPAMEKDGKIHDGQWNGKGNVISPSYGGTAYESFSEKGRYAYLNASSYEFIRDQIQAAYQ
ncbi:hypothetical protein [Acinetobacter pullicarnis]|uniref:hypothetical protein n=1 Tax=Acinetobacter pullicarnis TaxID=2576829 RepID=UPI001120A10B|nr:hypothetical protein [Acinetobacter pullicarnis]